MQQKQKVERLAERMRGGCIGARVGRLHRVVGRCFDQALRPLGLTVSQLEILSTLILAGPAKPAMIAQSLAVDRSTMSRNLALLEAKGLVAATELSPTGRSLAVAITDHGTATFAQAATAWEEAQAAVIELLGPRAPTLIDALVADV